MFQLVKNLKNMNKEEKLLKKYGWMIECESPFEIRHEDGSFATKQAAHMVVQQLEVDDIEENSLENADGDRFLRGIRVYGWNSEFRKEYESYMMQIRYDELDDLCDKYKI